MITSSNSLCRERDAQPSGRCYFTPCPVPSCPAYELNSIDGEYSRPFRHIQYKRTPSLRPMATLAMLLCRRIAKCRYRRRQSALFRTAACAASIAVVQSSFAVFASFFHQKCNLLKARVIIYSYQHVRLLPPESVVVNQSVLRSREPTLLCNQVESWYGKFPVMR